MNDNEKYDLIKFTDGNLILDVKVSPDEDTVWMTQDQIVALYQSSKSNILEHIKHILEEKELDESSVIRKFRTTASDGKKRFVIVKLENIIKEMILKGII